MLFLLELQKINDVHQVEKAMTENNASGALAGFLLMTCA